jgi:site-specific DNA-methyltransferase (adenine-specific)
MILHYPESVSGNLLPGQIVFMICEDGEEHHGEMSLRKAGLEVRDSIRYFHGSPVKHLTVVVGRKPLQGTVAENTLRYGCGGIHVEACRVPFVNNKDLHNRVTRTGYTHSTHREYNNPVKNAPNNTLGVVNPTGRFPANIIHDGSCDALFPHTRARGNITPSTSGGGVALFALAVRSTRTTAPGMRGQHPDSSTLLPRWKNSKITFGS